MKAPARARQLSAQTMRRVWRAPDGKPVSCFEKIKVLEQNIDEIELLMREALEDAVLMGCDPEQLREVLRGLLKRLKDPAYGTQRPGQPGSER